MREQHLLGGKRAWILLIDRGTRAEKRHLKAERFAVAGVEPAGDVPPFAAKFGMSAVIGWKAHCCARGHSGIARRHGTVRGRGCCSDYQHEHQQDDSHHQSSVTARTASKESARRPASNAVPAAAAISATVTVLNSAKGRRVSMVQ